LWNIDCVGNLAGSLMHLSHFRIVHDRIGHPNQLQSRAIAVRVGAEVRMKALQKTGVCGPNILRFRIRSYTQN
jgi:hypothetical protein